MFVTSVDFLLKSASLSDYFLTFDDEFDMPDDFLGEDSFDDLDDMGGDF